MARRRPRTQRGRSGRRPEPSVRELERLMAKGGFQLTAEQRDRLWRFHQLLREANARLNLSRIHAFEAIVEKHYVDSLLPSRFVELPSPLMDLGSGGGFPGIPLAIRHPEVRFVLVEGRRRRAGFLLHVVTELGLGNVEVVARKLQPSDAIPVQGVITRAFAAADATLERILGSLAPGGRALLLKGPNCDDEIAAVQERGLPFELEEDVHYLLPFSGAERRLLVWRRLPGPEGGPSRAAPPPAVPRQPIGSPTEGASTTASEPHAPPTSGAGPSHVLRSAENPRIRHWRALLRPRGVRKHGESILAGPRYVAELAAQRPEAILGYLVPEGYDYEPPTPAPVFVLARPRFAELDRFETGPPLAWVRVPELSTWRPDPTGRGVTLILPLQNPENLGAALRTAEAAGVREVVLTPEAAHPCHPKALRAAGPSPFRLRLFRGPTLAELRRELAGLPVYALDTRGTPLGGTPLPERFALVVGQEGPGTRQLSSEIPRLTIPMAGATESLNAAVALGIALYTLGTGGATGSDARHSQERQREADQEERHAGRDGDGSPRP